MTLKEQKLQELLASEAAKAGPARQTRSPAVFRETALDTHKTMPAEDFKAAYQNDPNTRATYGPGTMSTRRIHSPRFASTTRHKPDATATLHSGHTTLGFGRQRASSFGPPTVGPLPLEGAPVLHASVFKPKPGQEHVCSLAGEHRAHVANSEWALIDTLEVALYQDELEGRQRQLKAAAAELNSTRKQQVKDQARRAAAVKATSLVDREVAEQERERFLKEEAAKTVAQRQQHATLKAQLLTQAASEQAAAAAAKADRIRLEQAELEEVQRQIMADKAKAAAKVDQERQHWVQAMREDEATKAARRAELARQKREDAELVQAGLAATVKREEEAAEQRRAAMEKFEARANKASLQAVGDTQARLEREAALTALYAAQSEEKFQAATAAAAAKKAAARREQMRVNVAQLEEHAAKAAAAKAAVAAERVVTDVKVDVEALVDARKQADTRGRALATKDFLRTQMEASERGTVHRGVGMSDAERQLNARILEEATRIVGRPTQYSIKFP